MDDANSLVKSLLEKPVLLRQYAIWLETSETQPNSRNSRGEDMYNRLVGVMQGLTDNIDFIPGIGFENFVDVVGRVQKETGLDLGVCPYLNYEKKGISGCKLHESMGIASLNACLPPQRGEYEYRRRALASQISDK